MTTGPQARGASSDAPPEAVAGHAAPAARDGDDAAPSRGGPPCVGGDATRRGGGRTRSASLAASLSAVPGLGQLYNRQPGKAVFFVLATLLTIGPAILLITSGERVGLALLRDRHSGLFLAVAFLSILVFLALFLAGLGFWASSIVDARRTALERAGSLPAGSSQGRWWLLRL